MRGTSAPRRLEAEEDDMVARILEEAGWKRESEAPARKSEEGCRAVIGASKLIRIFFSIYGLRRMEESLEESEGDVPRTEERRATGKSWRRIQSP